LAAIQRVLAFSAIRRRCACSDITIRPNCSGETCTRWKITRGRTEGRILAALRQSDGVVDGPKGAAEIPDLNPNTFRHRMSKLGIQRSSHRQPWFVRERLACAYQMWWP
jgi:transcriptional regulator with GAF, ATPase, and Fis domain